jgi:hypothetical protein
LKLFSLTIDFLICKLKPCCFWKVPPLTSTDARGALLRTFDGFANDFARDCVDRHEAGDRLAARDIHRLTALADRLAADLAAWVGALGELDVASRQPLSRSTAGQLVVEGVFDDVLTPTATRLLRAALDLAMGAP